MVLSTTKLGVVGKARKFTLLRSGRCVRLRGYWWMRVLRRGLGGVDGREEGWRRVRDRGGPDWAGRSASIIIYNRMAPCQFIETFW